MHFWTLDLGIESRTPVGRVLVVGFASFNQYEVKHYQQKLEKYAFKAELPPNPSHRNIKGPHSEVRAFYTVPDTALCPPYPPLRARSVK